MNIRQNPIAIIIGATSGIGLEVARLLAGRGWKLGMQRLETRHCRTPRGEVATFSSATSGTSRDTAFGRDPRGCSPTNAYTYRPHRRHGRILAGRRHRFAKSRPANRHRTKYGSNQYRRLHPDDYHGIRLLQAA